MHQNVSLFFFFTLAMNLFSLQCCYYKLSAWNKHSNWTIWFLKLHTHVSRQVCVKTASYKYHVIFMFRWKSMTGNTDLLPKTWLPGCSLIRFCITTALSLLSVFARLIWYAFILTMQMRHLNLSPLDSCFSKSRIRALSASNVVNVESSEGLDTHTDAHRRTHR